MPRRANARAADPGAAASSTSKETASVCATKVVAAQEENPTGTRTTLKTSRLLEFASSKELVAQTGHEPCDWPLVIIKELIDNALDACEEAGVAPVINVTVDRDRIQVRDNGPGVSPATATSILDFTTRTSSREAYVAPDRGRQGNALKTVLAMPFALSGEEGRVEIAARGIRHEITFRVDRIAQQPVIDHQQHESSVKTGTDITVHWPESSWSNLEEADGNFLPLVSGFADLNPHLDIRAAWAGEECVCGAADSAWAKWTPTAPTSPHWYRLADLERLAGAYLSHDREHKTVRLLRDFVGEFAGLTATAKRKAVLDTVGLQRAPLERLLNCSEDFDHELVAQLLEAMKAESRPVKPKTLGAIGKDNIARIFAGYDADLETYRYKMIAGVDDGVPWVAEAAFAYRPNHQRRWLLCGVNWSPALGGGDLFDLHYLLGNNYCGSDRPIVVFAHLICPRPESLDRGKRRLSRNSPGFGAIAEVVESVTAAWAKQSRAELRDRRRASRRAEMLCTQYRPDNLKDLALRYLPRVIKEVSENGQISFTQRDMFYALRPLVQQESEKTFKYSYFKTLITDYENEYGEIGGLQREPRGTLYHPHSREMIPLSTESITSYHRPFWTFNKILYIEKAGTQKNLIEAGWSEEFDCAIATSAGFTTRAVKDLFDLLATSPEPVTVFCVHDADAAGTMIYHTLQNETKARGARKIDVINLGLEPWEGIEMGLEVEAVEATDRRRAVAPYVAEHDQEWRDWLSERGFNSWDDWLQRYRIELNAMPPMQRVEWLTRKIEEYPPRKVVPPPATLHAERKAAARNEIREELTRRANIEERTDEILNEIKWPDQGELPDVAAQFLNRHRKGSWRRSMERAGWKAARKALRRGGGR